MRKKVSVIIPCYNASSTLMRPWNSLKEQTMDMDDIEAVFIDDASDDNGATWSILQSIESEAPESVMIIRSDENLKQGGARNIGIGYASGEYLIFLDADDALIPEALEELYDKAQNTKADIVQFQHKFVQGDDSGIMIPKSADESDEENVYDFDKEPDWKSVFLTGVMGAFGCTCRFYKLNLLRESSSYFAENVFYEEPKFVYPLFLYVHKYVRLHRGFYLYYYHTDSTMTSKLGVHLLDHPRVQLELLNDLMQREEEFSKFVNEIEFHFIQSFYWETIAFSVINRGFLPLDFYKEMQRTCRTFFPNSMNNPFVKSMKPYFPVVQSIYTEVDSQADLDILAKQLGILWKNTFNS